MNIFHAIQRKRQCVWKREVILMEQRRSDIAKVMIEKKQPTNTWAIEDFVNSFLTQKPTGYSLGSTWLSVVCNEDCMKSSILVVVAHIDNYLQMSVTDVGTLFHWDNYLQMSVTDVGTLFHWDKSLLIQ